MSRPGKNSADVRDDPALFKYKLTATAKSLVDFHYLCPMPRAVLPSRLNKWLVENIEHGWFIQFPRRGTPSFRDTVVVFEDYEDMLRFRDKYCFKTAFDKRPHEADWEAAVQNNE